MYFVIIRHSIRDDTDNPHKYKSGENNDTPLSERGIKFAYQKAGELKEVLTKLGCSLDRCFSSPFRRTMHTAKIYKDVLELTNDKIIVDPLVAEGQNFKPPTGVSKDILGLLESIGINYPESLDHTKERCSKFLKKIIKDKKSCMVSTHGIVYNMLLQNIFPDYTFDPYLRSKDYIPRYCYATVLKFNEDKGKWSVTYSDVNLKN